MSAFVPAHAPPAVHVVPLVAAQVSVDVPPFAIVVGLAERLTVGAAAVTETVAACVALPPVPVQVSV
jgi:hypothetical protein